jgi:hypothetical protein
MRGIRLRRLRFPERAQANACQRDALDAAAPGDLAPGDGICNDLLQPVANQLPLEFFVNGGGHLDLDAMQCIERLAQEEAVVPPRLDDAAVRQKLQRRADRCPRYPDQIGELLFAKMMPRLQPGVADDIQNLVGQQEAVLTGRTRHGRDFGDLYAKYDWIWSIQYLRARSKLKRSAGSLGMPCLPIALDETEGVDCINCFNRTMVQRP